MSAWVSTGHRRGRSSLPLPFPPGTGFFVSSEGHLLTNHHVVDGCGSISVALDAGMRRSAMVVAKDRTNDLALLRLPGPVPATASFRPAVRLGEGIAVFGYPLTGILAAGGNFTLGNVTALAGIRDDSRMLQISAPVQPGNNGGPLLDETGSVVGVVVSKLNAIKLAAATDDLAQNVNFAIKGSVALAFMEAQGVVPMRAGTDAQAMKPADIADRAKSFTALVECRK
jgi:serine protease Do